MADYELWLDESGDFKEERKKKKQGKSASLVGGILIRKEDACDLPFTQLLDPEKYHATELTDENKVNYVLPILEKLQTEHRAREVFFENTEYEDLSSSKELYLRMISEGILRLMLRLNVLEESVKLKVLIARKQDSATYGAQLNPITLAKYKDEIRTYINQKKNEQHLLFNENSSLEIEIKIADETPALQLADFACNTRLTRNSQAFMECHERLEALYKEAWFFPLKDSMTDYTVRQYLIQGRLSDAILEVFGIKERTIRESHIKWIIEKISKWTYALTKSQLIQMVYDIDAWVLQEDDFELSEEKLLHMREEFVPKLLAINPHFDRYAIHILFGLCDVYLREGDILSAKSLLEECDAMYAQMEKSLENLKLYFIIKKKWVIYYVRSFQYEKAIAQAEKLYQLLKDIEGAVQKSPLFAEQEIELKTEGLGDIISLKIYAMLHLDCKEEGFYKKIEGLIEDAESEYVESEEELERLRKYHAILAKKQGKYEKALQYLMQAERHEVVPCEKEQIVRFWKSLYKTEVKRNGLYYLMYYLDIMEAAKQDGDSIADRMHEVLKSQAYVYELLALDKNGMTTEQTVNLSTVTMKHTSIKYHPMEIIYWKYGLFLAHCSKDAKSLERKAAREYLRKAYEVCYSRREYLALRIRGLEIGKDLIAQLKQDGYRREEAECWKRLEKEKLDMMKVDNGDE